MALHAPKLIPYKNGEEKKIRANISAISEARGWRVPRYNISGRGFMTNGSGNLPRTEREIHKYRKATVLMLIYCQFVS